MAPQRPILDDLELQQVQEIETGGERVSARHEVPALEGDFLQDLGRRGTRIDLSGVLTGPQSGEGLAQLREKFRAAEPVPFVSDIATATRVEDVVIEDLAVRELAGRPERYAYDIALREYTEPPVTTTEEPPEIEPPVIPPDDLGTLVVEVIVDGDANFDMRQVTVTALGPEGPGAILRTLTERSENLWTARDLAPGAYTAEALAPGGDPRGSASGDVRAGETTPVTVTLRPAARTAPTFLIHFHFDNAFIEPCMRHVLRQVAEHADAQADENLIVVGHTDRAGPRGYNQSLSERRARSAHAFLTFGRDADAAVAEWDELRKPRPGGVIRTVRDSWGTREYQHMLQDLGFYRGEIHGRHDEPTGDAVQAFRAAHGLPPGRTVDDAVWPVLTRSYMEQDNLAVPADRFLPNCPGEVLKWLGCSEHDPVRNIPTAWRPNRRTELLFVTAEALPCRVPRPDTFDKPAPGVVGSDWCLGGPGAGARCCFVTPADEACPPEEGERFCRESAEGRDRFVVRGSIRRQDGTPMANHHYLLIAPDGEFMDGEVPVSGNGVRAGTGIKGRTRADGTFEYPDKPKGKGVYMLEVDGPFVAGLAGEPLDAKTVKGPVVCKRLDGTSDLDVVVMPPNWRPDALEIVRSDDVDVLVDEVRTGDGLRVRADVANVAGAEISVLLTSSGELSAPSPGSPSSLELVRSDDVEALVEEARAGDHLRARVEAPGISDDEIRVLLTSSGELSAPPPGPPSSLELVRPDDVEAPVDELRTGDRLRIRADTPGVSGDEISVLLSSSG